jgi:hypothetical protein
MIESYLHSWRITLWGKPPNRAADDSPSHLDLIPADHLDSPGREYTYASR